MFVSNLLILLLLFALLILALVFGVTWKIKGLKIALIAGGILLVFIIGVFVTIFLVIPISMAS